MVEEHAHAGGESGHTHPHKQTQAVVNRLSRAIGHLERVRQMVADGQDCTEVLVQLAAVKAALNSAAKVILRDHLENCVIDAVERGDMTAVDGLNRAIDGFLR